MRDQDGNPIELRPTTETPQEPTTSKSTLANTRFDSESPAERRLRLALLGRLRRANLPRRHFDESAIFPDDDTPHGGLVLERKHARQHKVYDHIIHAPKGKLFALVGTRGCGKTRIAVACGVEACAHAVYAEDDWTAGASTVTYCRAMDFFLDVRAAYQDGASATEGSVIERYAAPELLIMDDLQDRASSDWEQRMLAHLIDKRYAAMRDTILIANIKPDDFHAHVGAAISDRLRECGGVIECDWGSMRDGKGTTR